uniref:Uncharacterized protein n=1 Tax=Fervidicoccus fontis TaxID=683846 RepID=A0A7C1E9L7_9CREN
MRRARLGVSGVLALVLISAMIIIFLISYAYVTEQSRRIQALMEERYRTLSESREIARSVSSNWMYDEAARILVLEVTNWYREPLVITGVVTVDNAGGYNVIRLNTTITPGENRTLQLALSYSPKAVFLSLAGKGPVSTALASQKKTGEASAGIKTWSGGLLDKIHSGYVKTQYGYITIVNSSQTRIIGDLLRGDLAGTNLNDSDLQKIMVRDNVSITKVISIKGRTTKNMTVEGTLNTTACVGGVEAYLDVSASVSLVGGGNIFSFQLYLYNYTTGSFDLIVNNTISINYAGRIQLSNGSYIIRLSVDANKDVNLTVDVANVYAYCRFNRTIYEGYALLIGDSQEAAFYGVANGSLGARLYSVAFNVTGYSLGANLSFSLLGNQLFHAYSDGSDVVVRLFDLGNITGGWAYLARCAGFGPTDVLAIEPLMKDGKPYLLVAGSQRYCLVDTSNTTAPSVNSTPTGIMIGTYDGFVTGASDYLRVYLTGINISSNKPSIFVFDGQSFSESVEIPVARPVGLAIGGGALWLMGDSGTLYMIDTATKQVSIYEVVPSFLPREKGDKLERIDNKLIFIRGDSTSEYWVLELG